MWNELAFLWNDLPIDWNDLTMERNDRKVVTKTYLRVISFTFFCHNLFGFG